MSLPLHIHVFAASHLVLQLYFLRHGESTWNVTFNRMKALFLFRLAYACIYETYLAITTGDSWFLDSPLWYRANLMPACAIIAHHTV